MPIDAQKESGRWPAPETFVYMVYSAGLIKIGTTRDLLERLASLRSMGSAPVSLIWVGLGDAAVESEFHKRFAKARTKGEWFHVSPEIVEFLSERDDIGGWSPLRRLEWASSNPTKAVGP